MRRAAMLMTLLLAVAGANAQVLEIYDDELYYQVSSDKGAHGAFDRIALSEIENDPVNGDYLEFDHDINASPSTSTYARIMFTSNGRLRRPSQYDTGMNLTAYNRLTFRARALQLQPGQTYPVAVGMGLDPFGSQDSGSKSETINVSNQWQTFNIDLIGLNPGGVGTLDSINCLFSLTFQKVHGSVVVDFDDIRYTFDPSIDLRKVYVDSYRCEGLITQGDGALVPVFQETTENAPVPLTNSSKKIKLVFDPSRNPGGTTWVRKALTHLNYWKNSTNQVGRDLTGCTTLKFRAVAVAPGASSYPVTFEMGKDFLPVPYDSGHTTAQIPISTNDWALYSINLNNLNPPPGSNEGNLSDINNLFNILLYEANGPVTLYIDDVRYEP
jgi:hypothetical protein